MLKKNQIEEAEITAMSSDGNGIAKIDGMVVFVPYTAVGDKLKIRIVKVQKNYSFGIIEEILQPSPDRVDDHCPVYKKCGGCAFRHISYEAELRLGRSLFSQPTQTGRIRSGYAANYTISAGTGLPKQGTVSIREYDGKIEAGFFAKRSHRVISCASCDLQPAFLNRFSNIPNSFWKSTTSQLMTNRQEKERYVISIFATEKFPAKSWFVWWLIPNVCRMQQNM